MSVIFSKTAQVDAGIRRLVGPTVIESLNDPAIQSIAANYDPTTNLCPLWAERSSGGWFDLHATLNPDAVHAITRMLATEDDQSLDPEAPFLNCTLDGRVLYHAALPPVSLGPEFTMHWEPQRH